MSLIHEALEKLEGEKKLAWEKPALASEGPEKDLTKSAHPRVLYGIAGILVFFFLAGLVYFLTTTEKSEKPSPSFSLPSESLRKTPPFFRSSPLGNQFALTGVSKVGTEWTAIVNNELVRIGERVDGATVQSIEDKGVILELNGQILKLTLYGREN